MPSVTVGTTRPRCPRGKPDVPAAPFRIATYGLWPTDTGRLRTVSDGPARRWLGRSPAMGARPSEHAGDRNEGERSPRRRGPPVSAGAESRAVVASSGRKSRITRAVPSGAPWGRRTRHRRVVRWQPWGPTSYSGIRFTEADGVRRPFRPRSSNAVGRGRPPRPRRRCAYGCPADSVVRDPTPTAPTLSDVTMGSSTLADAVVNRMSR